MVGLYITVAVLVLALSITSTALLMRASQIRKFNKDLKTYDYCQSNQKLACYSNCGDLKALAENINALIEQTQQLKRQLTKDETKLMRTVTNISHDLRTPVTSVLGYVNLLEKEIDSPTEKQAKHLAVIKNRIQILEQLISQLFEYTVTCEEDEPLELEEADAAALLEDCLVGFYGDITAKNIDIEVNLAEPLISMVNKLALKRVYLNIIGNAIKYAESKFVVSQEGTSITFKNNARELDNIDTEKLFDRFFTVGQARNNSSMGLGLTISAILMQRMGKKMSAYVENEMLVIKLDM